MKQAEKRKKHRAPRSAPSERGDNVSDRWVVGHAKHKMNALPPSRIEVLMAAGPLLLYLANRPIKDEWYHVTEVSDMQEYFEDIPLESVDCYWYVKDYSLGGWAYSYGISGKITVSDEYLEEIKTKYTDWEKQADIFFRMMRMCVMSIKITCRNIPAKCSWIFGKREII